MVNITTINKMRISIGDYFVNIGKNAKENWNILDSAEGDDIWFHLDNSSSPYVILEVKNLDPIPFSIINDIAKLCKSRSRSKDLKNVSVIYTTVSNLKKGEALGSVYLTNTPNKILV
jgi:predicted ribosome quality control (RQC) complex YloA/Tae2 family protein